MIEGKSNSTGYRERIYDEYGKRFQDAKKTFDVEASKRWARSCSYYLRGWLPSDLSASAVDLACGGGKVLHMLLCKGYRNVEGVDISPDQVALARQVTPSVTQDNLIAFLNRKEGAFDLITGFDIVEHFYKDEVLELLDASFRSLKPGGRLVLQTPNAESPWGSQHRYNDFTHEIGFNPNSLTRLLRLVGYVDVECRECGPAPHSLFSTVRFMLWKSLKLGMFAWNVIETGSKGSGVFTRVFVISGHKRAG